MVRVWIDEIRYVESLREYVRLHLSDKRNVVTKMQLGELETMLENFGFLRVHRSFIVAMRHIEAFTATEVTAGGAEIPVGRQYRETALKALESLTGA